MSKITQEQNPTARLTDGMIELLPVTLTVADAKLHIKAVQKLIKDCDVATIESPPMVRSLFESVDNPEVQTIYIRTDQDYHDSRQALKVPKDTIISLLETIMNYYKEHESLNIIISREVMRNRGETYHRYTAQFAQQVAARTQDFLKVKAIYSAERGELGIFCRKSEFDISMTFFGQLIAALKQHGTVTTDFNDMPDTYVAYPSMLHHKIKSKLSDPKVKMVKLVRGLKFSCEKQEKVVDTNAT